MHYLVFRDVFYQDFCIIIIIIIIIMKIYIVQHVVKSSTGRVVQWPNRRRIKVMVDNVIGRLAGNKMILI